ncbi:MAG: hypothetical protein HYY06_18910 [Deltaproteobacteria bacterium]|nr:hypothetical protein [Deltaproteobacteria bacterium]
MVRRVLVPLAVGLCWCDGGSGPGPGADAGDPDAGADAAASPDRDASTQVVESIFVVPREGIDSGFYDLPYPSDLRRLEPVGIDLEGFPNPTFSAQIDTFIRLLRDQVDGFSTNGAMYARFTGPIDESLLPDPTASREEGSCVALIDLDSGVRLPIEVRFQADASDYWAPSTLAVRPVSGFVLGPRTRYALVVTADLTAAGGEPIVVAEDLRAILGSTEGDDATDDATMRVYGSAIERLGELGLAPERIVSLAVFTTMDPVSGLFSAAEALKRDVAAPEVTEIFRDSNRDGYTAVIGRYAPAPFYQSGAEPFDEPGSGAIVFENGEPVLQREDELRFALAVPDGDMPESGFPLVVYSHGTGGDYKSFMQDGTAERLAAVGIASIGFDQVLHGERAPPDSQPETSFFNFLNPIAGRDNNRQSALDNVQQARLAPNLVVPSDLLPGGDDVFFDPDRQVFFGHSQGGLNGSLFLAIDDSVLGGVLSGTAGGIGWAILLKTEPTDILELFELILDLDRERENLDIFHPLITLLQTFIDPSDPLNFAPYWYSEPRVGAGRSILQTEGLLDALSPPPGIESVAVAGRLPLIDPVAQPVLGLDLLELGDFSPPVTANVTSAGGDAFTAGLVQSPDYGHWAVFEDPDVKATVTEFVRSVAASPPGTIE